MFNLSHFRINPCHCPNILTSHRRFLNAHQENCLHIRQGKNTVPAVFILLLMVFILPVAMPLAEIIGYKAF
jgi:hypothetical protein